LRQDLFCRSTQHLEGADAINARGENILEDVTTVNVEDIFKKSVEPGFKERFAPVTTHECWTVKISNDKAGPFGTCSEIFPDSFWTEIPPFF